MNQISEKLDAALGEAKRNYLIKKFAENAKVIGGEIEFKPINIAITGLPGFGKTSMVRQWADEHSEDINFIEMDASQLCVSLIEGREYLFSSSEIDNMALPNTVVFFDNFQYIKKDAEEQLNRFFDDRVVVDPSNPSIDRELGDVLFAVVAITV